MERNPAYRDGMDPWEKKILEKVIEFCGHVPLGGSATQENGEGRLRVEEGR